MDISNLPKGEFKIIINDDYFKVCDQNGKILYYENSKGYWWKREYDSNGNKIYYENSTGIKYFYDSDGNEYTEQEWNQFQLNTI